MIAFPDTSFLCALYVAQATSAAAVAHYERMEEPLHVSALLLGEFRQSVRFQIYRHHQDPKQGYDQRAGLAALAALRANLDAGALVTVPTDWAEVFACAEQISARHTIGAGHRFLDILHVATARALGASEFLSFDENQRRLARAEGLRPRP